MSLQLREPYQVDAVDSTMSLWKHGGYKRLVLSLATGLGKTECGLAITKQVVEQHGGLDKARVLIIAQNTALIYQMHQRFLSRLPDFVSGKHTPFQYPAIGIEMASHVNPHARIIVATRQTLARDNCRRLNDLLAFGKIDLLVIDEAHHSVSEEFLAIYNTLHQANPDMLVLGMTATLMRSDNISLGILFERISAEYPIQYGVMHGWLKPIRFHRVDAILPDATDESPMKTANWMQIHHEVWDKKNGGNRYTLHFLPSVYLARQYALYLQDKGVPTVSVDSYTCIDLNGKTHEDLGIPYHAHRRAVMDSIQSGEVRYVCNQNVFSEGYDWRLCNCVINSTTTESDATWMQRWGRGTRLPVNVENLMYYPDKNQYRVLYSGNTTPTFYSADNIPFYTDTLGLDFSKSTASMRNYGTLLGDNRPEKKEKTEELEEELEENLEEEIPSVPEEAAISYRVRELSIFKNVATVWYSDIENEMSTALGRNAPYMVYISAPKMALAQRVANRMQQLRDENTHTDLLTELRRLDNLYHVLSNYIIWVVEQSTSDYGHSTWTYASPANIIFKDEGIDAAYSELALAAGPANYVSELLIRRMQDSGMSVYSKDIKKLYKNTNPPSTKQVALLETLKGRLQKAGWRKPVIQHPATLGEAAMAINHFMAKTIVVQVMRDISYGKITLPIVDRRV